MALPVNNKKMPRGRFLTWLLVVVVVLSFASLTVPCPDCEIPILATLSETALLTLWTSPEVELERQMKSSYGGFLKRALRDQPWPSGVILRESHNYQAEEDQVSYFVDLSSLSTGVTDDDLAVALMRRSEVANDFYDAPVVLHVGPEKLKIAIMAIGPEIVDEIIASFDAGQPSTYVCQPGGIGEQTFEAEYEEWEWEWDSDSDDDRHRPGRISRVHGISVEACLADVRSVGALRP